jgi:FAD/FMN-containing dehydrogenase
MTIAPSITPSTPDTDPTSALPATDLADLRARLAGDVVTPADPDWDRARQAWNLAVDQRPDLVVHAETVGDVRETVAFAAARGLRVAPQGTGHGAPAMGDLAGTILLRTARMAQVEIDPVARRARVGAGALWQDVVPRAAEHGLAALAGSAADVGVVGYSLGGGIGWLARRYGLACNSILAAEVVAPDGRLLRVDRDHHPELFWALRGGGGSFGIVTALEFALYPVREVHAGVLFFPIERAGEVLQAWRTWTEDVPDAVTSVGRLLRFPPIPDLPEHLRGRSFVVVEACILDGEAAARDLLAPLRRLGAQIDTFATVPATRLAELHMDPPAPVPGLVHHRLLDTLTADALDAILAAAGPDVDAPLLSVELRHLGGALRRPDVEHGVLDHVAADYALVAVGVPTSPEVARAIVVHLDAVVAAAAGADTGRDYLNFAERTSTPARLFGEDHAGRLAAIAATYDPTGRLVANHAVRSA